MENASKALMIAAAILIVLLLISFAVLIINKVNPLSILGNKPDAWAIESFNNQFTPYETMEGQTITGQQVRALVEAVRGSNITNTDHEIKWVDANGSETSEPTPNVNSRYTTKMDRDNDGYINKIKVTQHKPQP